MDTSLSVLKETNRLQYLLLWGRLQCMLLDLACIDGLQFLSKLYLWLIIKTPYFISCSWLYLFWLGWLQHESDHCLFLLQCSDNHYALVLVSAFPGLSCCLHHLMFITWATEHYHQTSCHIHFSSGLFWGLPVQRVWYHSHTVQYCIWFDFDSTDALFCSSDISYSGP